MKSSTQRPPRLAELQDRLRRLWTEPLGLDAALSRDPDVERWIEARGPVPARTRLAVYSDGYFLRLRDALGADFKTVRRALGEEGFQRLAAGYLKAHPSFSPNLADLGERLPSFIGGRPSGELPPFLADLARLEWTVLESLHAERLPPLDAAALKAAPPEAWGAARCRLDPTARLLDLRWPVDRLWAEPRLKTLRRPSRRRLLVFRDAEWVRVLALDARRHGLLDALLRGRTLGEAFAGLDGARPAALRRWFAQWASDGVIKKVEFEADSDLV